MNLYETFRDCFCVLYMEFSFSKKPSICEYTVVYIVLYSKMGLT